VTDPDGIISQLVAWVRALLPEEWRDRAGDRFRKTVTTVSQFAEANQVCPRDLVKLGRRKLEGLGTKEFATMVRDFAEAENMKMETELRRRSLESDVRKKEAEAREAEIRVLQSEIELVQKLRDAGTVIRTDEQGHLTILPAPLKLDFGKLEHRFLIEGQAGSSNEPQR
jgi:hypothetical protein